jgi:hypothetical protein
VIRLIVALVLTILCTPAFAADWTHYANARFGYSIDVPPGFVAGGEADNGDGQVFASPTARLTIFGGNIVEGDFEAEARQRRQWATDEGWGLTYQVSTPAAASFSGKRGSRILYTRLIALCGGTQFAMFSLDYSTTDLRAFDPVVERLVRSLRAGDGGRC